MADITDGASRLRCRFLVLHNRSRCRDNQQADVAETHTVKRWHDGFQCQELASDAGVFFTRAVQVWNDPVLFGYFTVVVFSHKCRAWIEEDGCAQQHQRARVNESADSLRWPYYRSSREHSETSLSVNIHVFVIVQANNPCLLCGDDLYFLAIVSR